MSKNTNAAPKEKKVPVHVRVAEWMIDPARKDNTDAQLIAKVQQKFKVKKSTAGVYLSFARTHLGLNRRKTKAEKAAEQAQAA